MREMYTKGTSTSSEHEETFVSSHETNTEAAYWAEFYKNHEFEKGSSFFNFIDNLSVTPSTVLDIGCGDGRDSTAFAQSGRQVIGLDRSNVGVEHANRKSAQDKLDHNLAFAACDVSDEKALQDIIETSRKLAEGGNICYYMRFFLHSIPENAQESLLDSLSQNAQTGDVFAAEFRTDKDIARDKTFGNGHYRRYQNANKFSKILTGIYGWSIQFEAESSGFSPYGDEDPVLYRVVAVRE